HSRPAFAGVNSNGNPEPHDSRIWVPERGRGDERMYTTGRALLRLLEIVEEMQVVGCDRGLDFRPRRERQIRIDARDPDLAASKPNGEKLFVAELLGDHDGAFEGDLIGVHGCDQPNMLRAYADANRSSHARTEVGKPRSRKPELQSRAGQQKMIGLRRHVDGDA